jgi:hypothetical protein
LKNEPSALICALSPSLSDEMSTIQQTLEHTHAKEWRKPWPVSKWIDAKLIAMLEEELTGAVSDAELIGGPYDS